MKMLILGKAACRAILPALALPLILLSGCKEDPEPVIPTVKTVSAVTEITATTAAAGGEVVADGEATVTSRGVCWGTAPEPTTAESKSTDDEGLGTFTSKLTGLTPGIKYYLRAYAVNSVGTAYGKEISFTTPNGEATISTAAADNITIITARSGGNVSADGGAAITAKGVCWGTSAAPTTAGSKTVDGEGIGTFTSELTGLSPLTKYYARAYATNALGNTYYGNEVTFTTLHDLLTVVPGTLQATVESLGIEGTSSLILGGSIDQRDFVYMKSMVDSRSLRNIDLSGVTVVAYDSYRANEVPASAFKGSTKLISFLFPAQITSIGGQAFYGCSGLTGSLTIGNGVETIKNGAFYNCSGFTGSLDIPNSVTSIGDHVFYGCSGFTGSLIIPGSVTSIGEFAFYNCSSFTGSLTIGNGVETIKNGTFYNCSGFTGSLTIGDGVTSIGSNAFNGCSGFTGSLTIGSGVQAIGISAFEGCFGFTGSLTIGDGVTSIGSHAFNGCSGFTGSLTIGSGVQAIEGYTFYGCSGFTGSLTIGDGVTSIGSSAFNRCSGFTGSLVIPDSVTSMGDGAFLGCIGFTGSLTIGNGVETIRNATFYNCSGFTGLLTIGDGVTSIGQLAFYNCSGFTGSLTIPDSITSIGDYTFDDCNALNNIKVEWATPITYSANMLPSGKTVYVPVASVAAYQSASGWKNHPIEGY